LRGDPVVRYVGALLDDNPIDERAVGNTHPSIRYHVDGKPVALGHAYDLVFDGAGVGIDVNLHGRVLCLNQRTGLS
jgi:hypothetical protein